MGLELFGHRQVSKNIWDESEEQYRRGAFKICWELLDEVQLYQWEMISGNKKISGNLLRNMCLFSIDWLKRRMNFGHLRGLSLGCSESDFPPERIFMETGMFDEFEVMDIAKGLLKRQQKRMENLGIKGISYIYQDLNKVKFKKKYDFIWALGTIHHIKNLERLFFEINKALSQKGIFVMREYIGPNRIQLRPWQLLMVNLVLWLLPKRLKIQYDGSLKRRQGQVDIKALIEHDPSEAIRSEDIVPLMRRYFTVLHYAKTGGTLLHPLLSNIASNFEGSREGKTALRILIYLEKILISKGIIPSDYCFAICARK